MAGQRSESRAEDSSEIGQGSSDTRRKGVTGKEKTTSGVKRERKRNLCELQTFPCHRSSSQEEPGACNCSILDRCSKMKPENSPRSISHPRSHGKSLNVGTKTSRAEYTYTTNSGRKYDTVTPQLLLTGGNLRFPIPSPTLPTSLSLPRNFHTLFSKC